MSLIRPLKVAGLSSGKAITRTSLLFPDATSHSFSGADGMDQKQSFGISWANADHTQPFIDPWNFKVGFAFVAYGANFPVSVTGTMGNGNLQINFYGVDKNGADTTPNIGGGNPALIILSPPTNASIEFGYQTASIGSGPFSTTPICGIRGELEFTADNPSDAAITITLPTRWNFIGVGSAL